MVYDLRIVVALAACLFAAGLALTQQDGGHSKRPQNYAANNQEPASPDFAPGFIVDIYTYRAICEQPKDKDYADLCQQWRSAEAAEKQVWINALGLDLVSVSLFFTGWAARAASRAAKAAIDALGFERAWVTQDGYHFWKPNKQSFLEAGYKAVFSIAIKWKNTGRSPATKVDIWTQSLFIGVEEPIPTFNPDSDPTPNRVGILGPEFYVYSSRWRFPWYEFEKFKRNEHRWIIYSRITYGLTSDPESNHYTEFCGEIVYNGETEENGILMPDLGLQPIGPQNTAT